MHYDESISTPAHRFLHDSAYANCGIWPESRGYGQIPDLDSLRQTEWVAEFQPENAEFRQLCSYRLIMGAFRHGLLGAPDKPNYDRMASIQKRRRNYLDTGNTEWLVDIYNLLMLEYREGGGNDRDHVKAVLDPRQLWYLFMAWVVLYEESHERHYLKKMALATEWAFLHHSHPNKHFHSVTDHDSHAEVKK